MKTKFIWAGVLALSFNLFAATAAPREVWSVKQDIDTPESVFYDFGTDTIYVSNIAGEAPKKDGVGWISKLGPDGKVIKGKWVTGLNAPKGLRSSNGILWVADIDELIGIDIISGIIKHRHKIPGAKFLNDVATTDTGDVYVSDTLDSKIHLLRNGKLEVFDAGDTLESPNGLLVVGNELIVGAWGKTTDWSTKVPGRLFALDLKTKAKRLITPKPWANLDGLEVNEDGDFLVSDWMAGKVFLVSKDGKKTTLLKDGLKGSADIGYLPKSRLLIVPVMAENRVAAFSFLDKINP